LKNLPLGTRRSEVERYFATVSPRFDERRPIEGWSAHPEARVRGHCSDTERLLHKEVARAQFYETVHGVFSLAHMWFYYDSNDGLIDLEVWIGD
jgi:hypothetical protein